MARFSCDYRPGLPEHASKPAFSSCPQLRYTEFAPARIAALDSPLPNQQQAIADGKTLFNQTPKTVSCRECQGDKGDGNGPMASMFEPAPRNVTCLSTMSKVSDGQIYWIIKNGSYGTSMPAFNHLSEQNIWQLVAYVRSLKIAPSSIR